MLVTINKFPISAPFASIDPSHLIPHRGIDFAIPEGTPIPSIGDGVVTSITDEGNISFGKSVHVHMNNGKDVIYGHLSNFNVKVGQRIHVGDVIGMSGNTGDSSGAHLHLQVMKNGIAVDPASYLQPPQSTWDKLQRIFDFMNDAQNNGLFHAVTGQTRMEFAGNAIQFAGMLSLSGFLIALPIALFGFKFGRKWAILFVCGWFILTVIGAAMR